MHYKSMQIFGFFMCLFLISTVSSADSSKSTVKKCPPNCVSVEEYQEESVKIQNQMKDIDERILKLRNSLSDIHSCQSENEKGIYDSAIQTQSFWLAVYGLIIVVFGTLCGIAGFKKFEDIKKFLSKEVVDVKKMLPEDIKNSVAENYQRFEAESQKIIREIEELRSTYLDLKSMVIDEKKVSVASLSNVAQSNSSDPMVKK